MVGIAALILAASLAQSAPAVEAAYEDFLTAAVVADHWNTVCTKQADPVYYQHVSAASEADPLLADLIRQNRPEALRQRGRYTPAQCVRLVREAEREFWTAREAWQQALKP